MVEFISITCGIAAALLMSYHIGRADEHRMWQREQELKPPPKQPEGELYITFVNYSRISIPEIKKIAEKIINSKNPTNAKLS